MGSVSISGLAAVLLQVERKIEDGDAAMKQALLLAMFLFRKGG